MTFRTRNHAHTAPQTERRAEPASPLYRGAVAEPHRQLIQTLFEIERGA